MGSEDNHEMYTHVCSQLNKRGLAYLHVMDGLGFGSHNKCKVFRLMDARKVFDGKIIGNVTFEKQSAEGAVRTGAVDMIAFGRLYISNPDLVERFQNNYPVAEPAEHETWWTYPGFPAIGGQNRVGYTDFPIHTP